MISSEPNRESKPGLPNQFNRQHKLTSESKVGNKELTFLKNKELSFYHSDPIKSSFLSRVGASVFASRKVIKIENGQDEKPIYIKIGDISQLLNVDASIVSNAIQNKSTEGIFSYIEDKIILQENIQMARSILKETRESVRHSSNYLSRHIDVTGYVIDNNYRNQFFENSSTFRLRHHNTFETIRVMAADLYESLKGKKSIWHLGKITAYLADKYSIGNCGEMTMVALFKFMPSVKGKTRLDYAVIGGKDGNHSFLVIGRSLNSDPNNYKTWGPQTVICDVWGDEIIPLSEIEKLMNSRGVDQFGRPVLSPFNPDTQSLHVQLSNLTSPMEMNLFLQDPLADDQKVKYEAIRNMLSNFYSVHNQDEKKEIARQILNLTQSSDPEWATIQEMDIIITLTEQLAYFLKYA
jgi:hypothetical protein